jgi:hypothetical protein
MVRKDLKPRSLPIFLPTDDGIKYCLLSSYYLTKIAVSAGMVDSLKSYVKQTKTGICLILYYCIVRKVIKRTNACEIHQ